MSEPLIIDDVTYTFEDDTTLLGKWEYVDFVSLPSAFMPNTVSWLQEPFISQIEFLQNGIVSILVKHTTESIPAQCVWTKGHIINEFEKTNSSYVISIYDNIEYLFIQWKSGDYSYRGMTPYYYVFKRIINNE